MKHLWYKSHEKVMKSVCFENHEDMCPSTTCWEIHRLHKNVGACIAPTPPRKRRALYPNRENEKGFAGFRILRTFRILRILRDFQELKHTGSASTKLKRSVGILGGETAKQHLPCAELRDGARDSVLALKFWHSITLASHALRRSAVNLSRTE